MKQIVSALIFLITIGCTGTLIAMETDYDYTEVSVLSGNIGNINAKSVFNNIGLYAGAGYGLSGSTNRLASNDLTLTVGLQYALNQYGVIGAEYMMRKATRIYGSNNIICFYELPIQPIVLQLGLGFVTDTYYSYTSAYFGDYWREQEASGFGFRVGIGYDLPLFDKITVRPMALLNLGLEEYATNYALSINVSRLKGSR